MQHENDRRGPGLKFPPPLLALLVVGVSWLIDWFKPLPITQTDGIWLTGAVLILIAMMVAVVALVHFLDAKTHIEPWHPTTTIIRKGVYRFSRNPIYLSFCIATIGCGLILNSWWVVIGALPLAILLQQLVIKREETYLENKFGDDYLTYKNQVRRWL